jgi:hypothetical protein
MRIAALTFRPETARDFSLHGKIAASPLFCENEVLKKPSGFAQKSRKFPAGTSSRRSSMRACAAIHRFSRGSAK